jgi:hypothetical protein
MEALSNLGVHTGPSSRWRVVGESLRPKRETQSSASGQTGIGCDSDR